MPNLVLMASVLGVRLIQLEPCTDASSAQAQSWQLWSALRRAVSSAQDPPLSYVALIEVRAGMLMACSVPVSFLRSAWPGKCCC